jgi:ADP-ribose pyrophosphatase YjhB (NUDIX family)
MKLRTDVFDLWVFRRDPDEPRYLILHTSQEKADKWFSGGRFWQIPGGFFDDDEQVVVALRRTLDEFDLVPKSLWVIEHTYTYYNRRRSNLEIISVFAAEVEDADGVPLTWEHSAYRWATASECAEALLFRGLLEGLEWSRKYVTSQAAPSPIFQLA